MMADLGDALWLYDDARARSFEPLALTRPASALLAGTRVVRDRWALALAASPVGTFCAEHLATEFDGARTADIGEELIPAGTLIANSRCVPAATLSRSDDSSDRVHVWSCGGRVAAVQLAEPAPAAELIAGTGSLDALVPAGAERIEISGWWIEEMWDHIRHLPAVLADDIMRLARGALGGSPVTTSFEGPPEHTVVIGEYPVCVLAGAVIEPHVVLDTSAGPILIGPRATIQAFTRLVGPCYVGEGSTVVGDRVATCAIGPVCKVRGEVSTSVFLGYANKAHEGFVGHSYVGEWVNLGAGTTTSNLKNTYGNVTLQTSLGTRDTGMQFLGTLFGDHAKTGIGVRLTTGTIVGAGANVFGSVMPPKHVPPFAWGDHEVYTLDKFLQVAERAMGRRSVALSPGGRQTLKAAYGRATSPSVGRR
jgi:UDP-N-acetylglucosamine diphosphorylase/glucosamine-1-phosphate N-acetyltransferase